MKKTFWHYVARASLIFALFIAYIGLILVLESLGGFTAGLIALVFMPLFVLAVSFFFSRSIFISERLRAPAFLCPLCALIAAGLVHFAADKAINGFELSWYSAAFDAFLIAVCASGSAAAIKLVRFSENKNKRRRRFDD